MNNSITSATYIRNLNYGLRRRLSDFLDPQDMWKEVLISIRKPSGEFRYSQHHLRWVNKTTCCDVRVAVAYSIIYLILRVFTVHYRKFEGLVAQGKSPTVELLNDWGTSNSTVGELVDILKSHKLLAAAGLLLPGMDFA